MDSENIKIIRYNQYRSKNIKFLKNKYIRIFCFIFRWLTSESKRKLYKNTII